MRQVADEQTEHLRQWLYLALGAVLSILLAACTTVGGLIVVRIAARSGEIAVRKAMGATDVRITSQMLTEVGLIAVSGCALGALLSEWALELVNVYGPMSAPVALQPEALAFALALTLISTVLAGVLPARVAVRLPVEQTLRNAGTRATAGGAGTRDRIVAIQIAFAVVLISTAVEMNRSFLNLTRVPLGFEQHRVWTGAVTLPARNYMADQSWNSQFFEPLLSAVRSIPGIESASLANCIPFNPNGVWTEALRIPGRLNRNPHPEAQICLAMPGYFQTLGVPLIAGRTFTESDRAGATPVAIIDEELARRYFRNEEPIGKLISVGGADTPARIVGVVGTVHNSDLGGPAAPEVYYPQLQDRTYETYIALRVTGNLDPTASVRRALFKLGSDVALYDVQFLDSRVASSLKLRRFVDLLLNGLAAAGFALALIGLYSALAHLVELRRREIGIRAVLGVTRAELAALIVLRSSAVLAAGIGAGILAAIFVSQLIRSQLFETAVTDPAVWITSIGAVLLLALLSSSIPAWRAVHVEPAAALRSE